MKDIYVLLLNGPPQVGKDHSYNVLHDALKSECFIWLERFSYPLKRAVSTMLDMPQYILESMKDQAKFSALNGQTFRELQISMSEDWMKAQYGTQVFGKLLIDRIERELKSAALEAEGRPILVVVPDSGFGCEVPPILEKVPASNVLLIRLHRDGKDFSKDSRSYIEVPGVQSLDLYNTGDMEFEMKMIHVVRQWVQHRLTQAA